MVALSAKKQHWFVRCAFLSFTGLFLLFGGEAYAAKNIILMISDGGGHNAWLAASMYQGKVGKQVYDQPGWFRAAATTYPLNRAGKITGSAAQDESLVYDPQKAWNATEASEKDGDFIGYNYLRSNPTDSAASGTAIASGRKTYNGAINWTCDNQPLRGQTIAEIAKAQGKSAGVVTSVAWYDATPAALGGAHNVLRTNAKEIIAEMLEGTGLDVIVGASHPECDGNGEPIARAKASNYTRVGGKDNWNAMKRGQSPWTLVETKADFETLASGPTPKKMFGIPQASSALQQERSYLPFANVRNANVPDLATLAKAAINCLADNPKGFFLMIEGGAVDHANHRNQADRMIEEQIDFIHAVEAVVAWIESHGGWGETLLILTADHETGLIWGPNSGSTAFQPIEDRGPGKLPGMSYNSTGHTLSLVPLYARGDGAHRFEKHYRGEDPKAAACWRFSGRYVDNTDIFKVMKAAVEDDATAGRSDAKKERGQ